VFFLTAVRKRENGNAQERVVAHGMLHGELDVKDVDMKDHQVPLKTKLVFCIALIIVSHRFFASGIDDGLEQMRFYEKASLNKFFQYSTEYESLGYVLFFENKPACSIGCCNQQKDYKRVLCGWKVWKKYEHLFPHPNFIFCNEKVIHAEDCQMINLYIVNKKSLSKCISDNEFLFKRHLGENFSKENFIELIETTKDLDQAIANNELLRGIILGFGQESSNAFYMQNISLHPHTFASWTDTYCSVGDDQHCRIYSVGFMGNPQSEEVKSLLRVYRQERELIHKKFCCSKKKLKLVLEALCQS